MLTLLRAGIGLQVLFFVLFFGAILPKMNHVLGAVTSLIIGLFSLFVGIKSIKQKQKEILSILMIAISVIILGFTIFAYFLGEAGYPPLMVSWGQQHAGHADVATGDFSLRSLFLRSLQAVDPLPIHIHYYSMS